MGAFNHKLVGGVLDQGEFEEITGQSHVFASQATGMMPYASSTTILTSLAIGSAGDLLMVAGGIPSWGAAFTANTTWNDNVEARWGTGGDSRIYYDGVDTFWDLRRVGSGDLMIALAGSFPSPDPNQVHIWAGSAGAATADVNSILTLEDSGASLWMQMLAPDASSSGILFGNPTSATDIWLRMYGPSDTPASTFGVRINGSERLLYSATTFAFQETTVISSTGTLQLTAPTLTTPLVTSGHLTINDNQEARFGTGGDSRIYYDGVDTFWDLRRAGSGDLMIALAGSFPSPDPGAVHIWNGSAGAVAAPEAFGLVLENSGASLWMQMLAPDASSSGILFGNPTSATDIWLRMYGPSDTPASTFGVRINGSERLLYSATTFAFQETTVISSTGTLQLTAPTLTTPLVTSGHLTINDNQEARFGTGGDSRIYYDGVDTFWDLRRAGSGDLMIALAGSFPSPDPDSVHIWRASAGAVAADASSIMVLEGTGNVSLSFLTDNANSGGIVVGDPEDNNVGIFRYAHGDERWEVTTNAVRQFHVEDGVLDFRKAFTFSGTGSITLTPNSDVIISDGKGFLIGHTVAISLGGVTGEIQIQGTADADTSVNFTRFSADASGAIIRFGKGRGALGTPGTAAINNDVLGEISFNGDDAANIDTVGARIFAQVDGTPSSNRMPTELHFATANGSSNDDIATRMTLKKAGDLSWANAAGPIIINEAATSTNPTLVPNKAEEDTGIGWQSADKLAFIVGGTKAWSMTKTQLQNSNSHTGTMGSDGNSGHQTFQAASNPA